MRGGCWRRRHSSSSAHIILASALSCAPNMRLARKPLVAGGARGVDALGNAQPPLLAVQRAADRGGGARCRGARPSSGAGCSARARRE